MPRKFIAALILLFIVVNGCKDGAASLPELTGKLFNALKSGSEKKFDDCIPRTSDMQNAYKLYFADPSKSAQEQEEESLSKAASTRLSLQHEYQQLMTEAKDKKIEWGKTVMKDFKYNLINRKEGFKEAKVRMILETNGDKNVVVFDAWQVEDRWFVVQDLGWED